MLHFHTLQVKKVEKDTESCVVIELEVPAELKDTFQFKQGQNITIKKKLLGEEIRRNYSICSSPLENKLKIAVKRVDGGLFSNWANGELKAGDFLDVMPPTGEFYTELNPLQQKAYVAFAAGSGITPIISIIKTTLLTELSSTFTLIYANRTKASILFKEELQAIKDQFIDRFRLVHVLSREVTDATINSGRLDKAKCELLFTQLIHINKIDEFFICGPEAMIFCIKGFLEEKGVTKDHIHFELFTVPGVAKTYEDSQQSFAKPDQKAQVTIKLDGLTFSFQLAYSEDSILNAALDLGADLPYSCKGGVCTTCKAKLTEGNVEMDRNFGLAEEEVQNGFILTCQSHPASPTVFVDFDAR